MKKTQTKSVSAKRIAMSFLCLALAVVMLASCGDMFILSGQTPIKFLMKENLSKYVDVSVPNSINYADVRESLEAGYDLFRVNLTETYFGKTAYIEEGCTVDFTLGAELVTTTEEGTTYTEITLPEKYVIYRGQTQDMDGVQYVNVEE